MSNPLVLLATAWSQPFEREHVLLYGEFLADIPLDELEAAVRALITTSTWRPSIAEIRRAVLDRRQVVPTPELAAAQAAELDRWDRARQTPLGATGTILATPEVHPTVWAAWHAVGAQALPAVFAKAWRAERDAFLADVLAAPFTAAPALGVTHG